MTFCEEVRKETDLYWEGSFKHPFVRGLVEGTLPIEKFKFYIMQDAYYLKHYTKVLAIAASKADTAEDTAFFLETACYINEAELELHRTVFQELGVTEQQLKTFEPAPATYNYVSHMYNCAYNGDAIEAFAAILPCPWLYQEIGAIYKDAKPGVKLYEEWIAMYSSQDYAEKIHIHKSLMDRFVEDHPEKKELVKAHFNKSCYYEWKFWEMPWILEDWKGEVTNYEYI